MILTKWYYDIEFQVHISPPYRIMDSAFHLKQKPDCYHLSYNSALFELYQNPRNLKTHIQRVVYSTYTCLDELFCHAVGQMCYVVMLWVIKDAKIIFHKISPHCLHVDKLYLLHKFSIYGPQNLPYGSFQVIPHASQDEGWLDTLRPRQDGRHFPDDIFKCIF